MDLSTQSNHCRDQVLSMSGMEMLKNHYFNALLQSGMTNLGTGLLHVDLPSECGSQVSHEPAHNLREAAFVGQASC